jgi:hypothetical protein
MSSRRVTGVGTALIAVVLFASACTLASPTYVTDDSSPNEADLAADAGKSTDSSAASTSAGGTCAGTFAKVEVSTLTPCGNGKGHCYDKTKTPNPTAYIACPNANEICVPDTLFATPGGRAKSCSSIAGPGACATLELVNVPEADKENSKLLKPDICTGGDVCTPCIDPRNQASTGACEPLGVFDRPCAGGSASAPTTPAKPPEACCTTNGKSSGICLPADAIPPEQKGDTIQDTCSGGNQCVPAALANGTPVKCNAGLIGSGVCIDKCFSSLLSIGGTLGFLRGDGCSATEECVPCLFLKGKGAPGCQ